jgi:hypothetical protein
MQALLREKLMDYIKNIKELSNIYKYESYKFVDKYYEWLEKVEHELERLKNPIGFLLQSEKILINSVLDGNIPEDISRGRNMRKCQRAAAAQSLEHISSELYINVKSIDKVLEDWNEKLSQGIAVLAYKEPDLYDSLNIDNVTINSLWLKLSQTQETLPVYNYLRAKLSLSDINYLLTDIIQKIINNKKLNVS